MNESIQRLLQKMSQLERELAEELHRHGERLHYRVVGRRVEFSQAMQATHARLRMNLARWLIESRPLHVLTMPFIYGMIFPLLILDVSISIYQAACFPLYGIAKVRRRDYFAMDHRHLAYLNAIEKLYCVYCSYASGLLAYSREIAACTEQYWCPIKHARAMAGGHSRYPRFIDYGDPENLHAKIDALRRELAEERDKARLQQHD